MEVDHSAPAPKVEGVRITGIDIPFWDMVWTMVNISIAAIPAAIIVGLLLMLITALFAALAGDSGVVMMRRSF